ncbi:MAG: HAD-IIIC family phosphatase [Selenomonadaceae bacterium]|nr:HAD-IIIC family phosphatase [Selenomonadaceae bacterium]
MLIDSIKLVIWDLDDTFWQGIISEGDIALVPDNVQAVQDLLDRGIMNSICSKNDFGVVHAFLSQQGNLWERFVFPSINWEAKGYRIRKIIEDMNLRPTNVLFIDDNEANLNEARFYCPDIQILPASRLSELYTAIESYKGKMDFAHSRLERYRVLETKQVAMSKAESNLAFLKASDIRVYIDHKCQDVDRIVELVGRTNQLNYTKLRQSRDELLSYLKSDEYDTASIYAKDSYGDYGCIGFYCLEKKEQSLIHFLFSCRTLGMGIEQWVYQRLSSPTLKVVGQVANPAETSEDRSYIREISYEEYFAKSIAEKKDRGSTCSILFKGPCDLEAIVPLMENMGKVKTEFNYIGDNDTTVAGFNHSAHILESLTLSDTDIETIIQDAPFMDPGDFKTNLFSEHYDIVFYSLLPDEHQGVYKNKNTGWKISYNSLNYSLTDPKKWEKYITGDYENNYPFTEDILRNFSDKYQFIGGLDKKDVVQNLKAIREKLPQDTLLVLMLGSEIESEVNNEEFANSAPRHIEINNAVKELFKNQDNVEIINMTDFITSQDCFNGCTNHFSKKVYFEIAQRAAAIINTYTHANTVVYEPDSWHMKVKRRMAKFKHSFDKRMRKLKAKWEK